MQLLTLFKSTNIRTLKHLKNILLNKRRNISIIILLVISTLATSYSFGQNPFIPKYDAVKRSERCFTVTWEANNQFGAVWWADKVNFSSDTAFNFVVYMGDRDGNGADGLAFVMHQDSRDTITDPSQQVIIGGAGTWDLGAATGDDGGGLGFAMHQSRVGPNTIPGPHGPGDDPENHKIQNSVAVEMDTWNNNDVPDGNNGTDANGVNQVTSPYFGWDHAAVIYNGDIYGGQQVITDAEGNSDRILPLKPGYAFGTANNPDGSPHHNIEDDRCYLFQIRWDVQPDGTQDLSLWADVYNGSTNTDGLQLVMTHNDDMINNVFGGDPVMRFGFTGSTGGAINEQTICLLGENLKPFAQDDFASIPMNTTTVVDVEANDNDPDGDQLHVPIIMDPARNGSATIFDSLDVNYMRYTPNTNYVGVDTVGYVTCDVNSTKCYAKCDTAYVFIDVGCVPFDIAVNTLSANTVCSVTVPANGSAEAIISGSALAGTLWYEGFEDVSDGATSDNGTSAWSMTTSGSCNGDSQIEVDANQFRARNTGCEVIYETEAIDISGVSNVNISVDLQATGDMENADYLQVYYILDGGSETALSNGLHTDNFNTAVATISGLNGNSLSIRIKAKNSADNENYYWDNIHFTAIGAGTPNVSYYWYPGSTISGTPAYTGSVHNTMNHGTYTVQAIDNNTGCPSNPYTVVIDSTGYQLSGGFIEQLSPFTNCELPYDGELGAGIYNGTDTLTVGFTFEWFHQEDPKIPSFIQRTGPIAQNLESREYTVIILENATGCDTTINAEVPNAVSIPTVTATKISDVTSCTNPNSGVGEANVGGVTTGFTFEWYIGPSIGAGPADFTGTSVNTFPVGTYTVHAIDGSTSCPSDPATISIVDLTASPILEVTVDSEQISCDTLSPTGQLSGAVDLSGTPTTSGYTFNWHKGPNDIIPARPGYTGGPTVDGLEVGNYRLVVVEDATNCTSFVDTLIQDMTITPPDITLNSTNVTSCAAPNGTITAAVTGNLADYTFDLYKGNGIIADSLLMTSATNVFQNLAIGNYTVIGRDLVTRCATNPAFTSISDATVLPDANLIAQDQTSCDPANLTGQLTANMGFGAISDYTYEWFEDDFSNPLTPSSVDGEIISNLDSGDYILRITNNTTSCENLYYPTVNIGIVLPIEQVASTPSDHCGVNANGQLSATVDGGLTEVDGYTFIWENDVTNDTLSVNTAIVGNVEPGDYILTVINNATTCASNPAPITVDDITVTPIPTIALTDNSSCDVTNPNGQLEVTATNESPLYGLSDYSYGWYDNTGTLILTTSGPNGEIVNSLNANTYELRIQNITTSCDNSVLSQINNINIKPIIDAVTPDPASSCVDPYNSGATVVSVNGGSPIPAGYAFVWSNLDGGPVITGSGSIITDINLTDEILPPGNYQVMAYNEFNCPSDPVTFEILDNAVNPTFSLMAYNNISCNPANPIGTLVASRPDMSYTISTYEWYTNNTSGSLLATTTPPDSILYNLASGNYAVQITDATTGCISVEYASIQDIPANNPVLINTYINGLTSCVDPNGEFGLEVNPIEQLPLSIPDFRTYTFYSVNASSLPISDTTSALSVRLTPANASDNAVDINDLSDPSFNDINAGDWTSLVIDNYTHCISQPVTITIDEAPSIIISAAVINNPASCVGTDGIIEVAAETTTNNSTIAPATNGYNFTWNLGADGSGSAIASTDTKWISRAENLSSDYYFVNIEDLETGCIKDTSIFLNGDNVPTLLSQLNSPSTQCSPGNGGLTVEVLGGTFGIGKDYDDYDFILFEGEFIDVAWPANGQYSLVDGATDIPDPVNGPVVFNSTIEPGIYTVIAREKTGAYCFGEALQIEIELDFVFPEFAFAITEDKSCVGGTGTGQVIENAPGLAGNIDYSWHPGTDNSSANISNTNVTSADSYSGNYYLTSTVTSNIPNTSNSGTTPGGLGCVQDSIVTIPKILDVITLIPAITPNNNCVPFDGTIQVIDVLENGGTIGAIPGNYVNFNIFDANLNPYIPASGDGVLTPWDEIGPGNYYLEAQNNITKCFSETAQVTINDLSVNPVITVNLNNPDFGCTPAAASGELEAFSTGGSQNTNEFTFDWFQGNTGGTIVSNNPDTYLASGLTANSSTQLYTIEVVDTTGLNEGCRSTMVYTLVHQPTTVSVLNSSIAQTDQTICAPNGEILITNVRETINGVSTDYGSPFTSPPSLVAFGGELLDQNLVSLSSLFTFDPNSGSFLDNTGDIDSIPAGTYYVQAANTTNGCSYGPLTQVIIKDISKNPIISANLVNPDYACIGGTNTGELSAIAEGGSDGDNVTTNFAATWTLASDGSAVPTSGSSYNAVNLWPDVYTLTVVDADGDDEGCESSRDYLMTSARHINNIFASGTDQTICFPDGTIQIDDVTVDGTSVVDPHLSWDGFLYSSNNSLVNPAPAGTGFVNPNINDPFTSLTTGMYLVRTQDDYTKCFSNPYQVILNDISEDPIIDVDVITPQYSLNPNPLSWTGALLASVSETDGSVDTYNLNWHHGLGTTNQIPGEVNSAIDSLNIGIYTYTAYNTSTGCDASYYIYLPFEFLEPIFNTSLKAKTICSPLDGAIEVTNITLDGSPDLLSDYTFDFHDNSYNLGDTPDYTIPGNDTRTAYDNINSGSYYIIAEENWWMLESYPVQVDVIDSTTNPIISFDVTNYHAVTSCDESVFADGALAIEVYEDNTNPNLSPPFSYSYTWHNGPDSNPANIISGEVSNTILGVPSGDYTVLVVNLANNCESESTYTIEDVSTTPIVVASQTPNTNCPVEIANGIVTANVINSNNQYYYQWSEGTDPQSSIDYSGVTWRDRPIGYYTVIAIDQGLATCISEPVTIKVEDATKNPIIVINEISPVTNCDPGRPNGVLSATTQDGIAGHTFEWFVDGNIYSTGPTASDLGLFEYLLTVTNNVTQCQTSMSSGPTELLSVIPQPEVDILSDRTSCLEPDGTATASISGNVVDYIFRYYNKFSGEELSNFYEDYTIYDLDTSTYLVTAESRITGCISDPSEFAIANESYFPEIDVIADPSNCQEPSGGANVIISDMTRDFKVTWYGDNGFETQEKEIVYIPVGKYRVEVEGTDGCISSTEAEVKGDVIIYNGVSANNDDLNDYFALVCLEYFPTNNVKIYNRAGLLVYEQDFYDMHDPNKRFNGYSNKGASIIGTELPIGTYFYVVDKNDGDKAKVGYLELNR